MRMNFQAGMIPGICALAVGALLTMGAGYLLKHKKEDEEAKK